MDEFRPWAQTLPSPLVRNLWWNITMGVIEIGMKKNHLVSDGNRNTANP